MPNMPCAYCAVNRILDICRIFFYVAGMGEPKDPRIIIPIPRELLDRINEYRFDARKPTRADAIRHLIELGLEAARKGQPKKRDRAA